MRTIGILRRLTENTGDLMASPAFYFPFIRDIPLFDTLRVNGEILKNSFVILGGGGMVGYPDFFNAVEMIKELAAVVVGWGVGHNIHGCNTIDWTDHSKGYALLGIRDFGHTPVWVPCASCMSPLFDNPSKGRQG